MSEDPARSDPRRGRSVLRPAARRAAVRIIGCLQSSRAYRNAARRLVSPHLDIQELQGEEKTRFLEALFQRSMRPTRAHAGRVCWGISLRGRPAGTVTLLRNSDKADRLPGFWVVGLYVRPLFRGAGVGERLNRVALAHAESLGAETVYAWTRPGNARMLGSGAKVGFRVVCDPVLEAQCRSFGGKSHGQEQLLLRADLRGDSVAKTS